MENRTLAGRYVLDKRIGIGGMADVFVARDIRLERAVAVKLFRPGTADGLERGSAEARLLAGLDHPGLVRVLDMDNGESAGDGAYLVMELVPGPDLGVLLRTQGALGREGVRLMALDLARTLQYIHDRGIVHRDIKPSNILTRQAASDSGLFRYLLTDFGIARFFDGGRMTATGQVIGSAAYFSPEQARGDGVAQPSDVYSLGLVMIEALTGERAFPGTGVESALARLHRSPSIPHAAGPALAALLVSMTLDDPAARPDAASVVRALSVMGPLQPAGAPAHLPSSPSATASMPVPPAARTGTARDDDAPTVTPSLQGGPGTGDLPRAEATTRSLTPQAVEPFPVDGSVAAPPGRSSRPRPPGASARARRRRARGWLLAVVIALLAVALWVVLLLSGGGPSPGIEPLPLVPGEPGERLQELYESVQ